MCTQVKLRLLKRYSEIEKVGRFINKVQDIYSLQLGTIETITGNLKICCLAHKDCKVCPYYILEFNDVNKHYSLWKPANMDWKFDSIFASLYMNRPLKGVAVPVPQALTNALSKLMAPNFDVIYVWDCLQLLTLSLENICWDEYSAIFCSMVNKKHVVASDHVTLKCLVALVALLAVIESSKRKIICELKQYDAHVQGFSTTVNPDFISQESVVPCLNL